MNKYVLIAVVAVAFLSGYQVAAMKYKLEISVLKLDISKAEADAQKRARQAERELQGITDKYNAALANPKVIYKTITKEVVKYAQDNSVDKCVLHDDWVSLHDQAARPDITRSADRADEADRAITDDHALMVVAENYELCNGYILKLEAWQNWWREIKDAY